MRGRSIRKARKRRGNNRNIHRHSWEQDRHKLEAGRNPDQLQHLRQISLERGPQSLRASQKARASLHILGISLSGLLYAHLYRRNTLAKVAPSAWKLTTS